MIAVIHGSMKKNNVGAVFRSAYLHFALPRQNAPEGQPLHWKQLGNPAFSAHASDSHQDGIEADR